MFWEIGRPHQHPGDDLYRVHLHRHDSDRVHWCRIRVYARTPESALASARRIAAALASGEVDVSDDTGMPYKTETGRRSAWFEGQQF